MSSDRLRTEQLLTSVNLGELKFDTRVSVNVLPKYKSTVRPLDAFASITFYQTQQSLMFCKEIQSIHAVHLPK